MKVKLSELAGVEVQVSFRRTVVVLDKSQPRKGFRWRNITTGDSDTTIQASIATECRIVALPNREICASGMAICDSRDVFDKAKGRRKALAVALKKMKQSPTFLHIASDHQHATNAKPEFHKVKLEIWTAYFTEMQRGQHLSGALNNLVPYFVGGGIITGPHGMGDSDPLRVSK